MRRIRGKAALLAATAAVTAGCAQPGPPELTVYADGTTVELAPVRYCDVVVSECEQDEGAERTMKLRPGQPAQISVPSELAETPWLVNVQSVTAEGDPLQPQQEVFTPADKTHAYTARPDTPQDRLLVIEVQQLGAAYVQEEGGGEPELLARGMWTVAFEPR